MHSTRVGAGIALVATVAVFAATANAGRPPVIGCRQAVHGGLDGWRSAPGTILAGSLGWPAFGAPRARSFYGPHRRLAVFVKGLLVVKPRQTVTVRIPAGERGRFSLYYGKTFRPRAQWHNATWFRVSDGVAAITFRSCAGSPKAAWTQFAGGFLVRGPQCPVVEVRARGSERWLRRRISFGRGTCR